MSSEAETKINKMAAEFAELKGRIDVWMELHDVRQKEVIDGFTASIDKIYKYTDKCISTSTRDAKKSIKIWALTSVILAIFAVITAFIKGIKFPIG